MNVRVIKGDQIGDCLSGSWVVIEHRSMPIEIGIGQDVRVRHRERPVKLALTSAPPVPVPVTV